jgi:hypothetical protein
MAVDLHKKAERAGIVLKKQGIANPPRLRVGLMMDISGSMHSLYEEGVVQEVLNHVLGLAMAFDPTHKLDVFVFDHQYAQLPDPATPDNFHDYVRRKILTEDEIPKFGTTKYAGVIHAFQDHYFGHDPAHQEHLQHKPGLLSRLFHHGQEPVVKIDPEIAKIPVLGLLITDGDNDDHRQSEVAIQRSADFPVFWSLVGVGDQAFRFLKQIDREFDDSEFIDLEHLNISDDQLYAELVSPKLVRWLKSHPPR